MYQTLFSHITNKREIGSPSKAGMAGTATCSSSLSAPQSRSQQRPAPSEEPGAHNTCGFKALLIAQSTYYANPQRWVREHWENNPIQIMQRKELKKETNGCSFTFSTAGLETKQHPSFSSNLIGHADLRTSSKVTQPQFIVKENKALDSFLTSLNY